MVAGAGSGKTTSLVKALDHVGKRYGKHLWRRGQQIACITYTEVATEEIWGDVGNNPLFHVSTIHSFLWSLAKPFQNDIHSWVAFRIEEKIADQRQKIAAFGPRTQQRTRENAARELERLSELLSRIAEIRSFTYESGSDYAKGLLGHDDIIKMVPHLIANKPLLCKIFSRKYPFCFVDESQDTFPEVADALKTVALAAPGSFCLGFFGDPMQKIYGHGVGEIGFNGEHKLITKPENFRCPMKVLSVINRIRADGDQLQQTRGRMETVNGTTVSVEGRAKMFVLPADTNRTANLRRVREWMAKTNSDPLWLADSGEGEVRILVIVHRMAAARLGFSELFAAFNDQTPDAIVTGFREGSNWALRPFLDVLLPLASFHSCNQHFEVMQLLRESCPQLNREHLKAKGKAGELLQVLKEGVNELSALLAESGSASVCEILNYVQDKQLIRLDERFEPLLASFGEPNGQGVATAEAQAVEQAEEAAGWITSYLACPARELWGYYRYLMENSPYSTQQGIKGAEFERVIVVLDDEESRHTQYSYEKLLGLKAPSDKDRKNIEEGKETVFDRTRRLFYVCCSRATLDLAVVLYSADVDVAANQVRSLNLFDEEDVLTLNEM
jgi:DNA helicase-2/ATP-dependent DNA helicase PcrA